MKTIFNKSNRESLIERLNKLDSEKKNLWGEFTCVNMLAHLADALKLVLGKLSVKPIKSPFFHWPLNKLAIHWLPMPKNASTAPELIARKGDSIETERELIIQQMEEFANQEGSIGVFNHPIFGKLSKKSLGVLIYKHTDHHLKQFGV